MAEQLAFNRDCMEAMKEFPDGFFDLAVVDPPYGIGADNFKNGAGASKDGGKLYSTAVKMKNRLNQGGGKIKKPGAEYVRHKLGRCAASGIL